MTQLSDDLFLGNAATGMGGSNQNLGNPSPMGLGVGPMGRVYVWDSVPQAANATAVAALQTLTAAGDLALTGGTGGVVLSNGVSVLDVPRTVTLSSANALAGVTFTIYGTDYLGAPMSQQLAGPAAGTVETTKAFKTVTRIAASAAAAAVSAGTGTKLGIPVRVTDAGYIVHVGWNNLLADDAGTLVTAVLTDPATPLTGDVRGTFVPSSAADGVKRLVMVIAVPAIGSGPNATRTGAVGVLQA